MFPQKIAPVLYMRKHVLKTWLPYLFLILFAESLLFPAMVSGSSFTPGAWRMVGGEYTKYDGFASLVKGDDKTIFAGGDSGVAIWMGNKWKYISTTPVHLVEYSNGRLYVIGNFSEIEGCKSKYIACWNGMQWTSMEGGIHSSGPEGITTMAVGADGSLFVGGAIDSAGGMPAQNLVRWNGTAWDNSVGGKFDGVVTAVACGSEGTLYAATSDVKLYCKTGNVWEKMVLDIGGVSGWPRRIDVLKVIDGSLYVGGFFPQVDGKLCYSGLIRKDGERWHLFQNAGIDRVTDIEKSSSGDVYVISSDDYFYINTAQNDIRIDYQIWRIRDTVVDTVITAAIGVSTVHSPPPLYDCSIVVDDSTLFYNYGKEVFTSREGKILPLRSGLYEYNSDGSGKIDIMSSFGDRLYVSGKDIAYNGRWLGSCAMWDGMTWSSVGLITNRVSGLKATADGGVIISLYNDTLAGIKTAFDPFVEATAGRCAAKWLNGVWTSVGKNDFPEVVKGRSDSFYRTNVCRGYTATKIYMFKGDVWDTIGTVFLDTNRWGSGSYLRKNPNPQVYSLTITPAGELMALGRFDYIMHGQEKFSCNNIARWDGEKWISLQLPELLSDNVKNDNKLQTAVFAANGTMYVGSAEATPRSLTSARAQYLSWVDGVWTLLDSNNNDIIPIDQYSHGGTYDRTYELLADGTGLIYRNFSKEKWGNGLSFWDGSSWNSDFWNEHPELSNTRCLTLGPDNSVYCINYDNNGRYSVLQYSRTAFIVSIGSKKTISNSEIISFIINADRVNVHFARRLNGMRVNVQLCSLDGRIVNHRNFTNVDQYLSIPIKTCPPGVYLVKVVYGATRYISKIILTY